MSDLADALCTGLVVGNLLHTGDGLKLSMGEPILHAVEHLQRLVCKIRSVVLFGPLRSVHWARSPTWSLRPTEAGSRNC
jgi:hypothetical protein